jgi:hypothetical protein
MMKASIDRMRTWAVTESDRVCKADKYAWMRKMVNSVTIAHQDGSFISYTHAFMVEDTQDAEFVWVFTEHHGYHVFYRPDCDSVEEFSGSRLRSDK